MKVAYSVIHNIKLKPPRAFDDAHSNRCISYSDMNVSLNQAIGIWSATRPRAVYENVTAISVLAKPLDQWIRICHDIPVIQLPPDDLYQLGVWKKPRIYSIAFIMEKITFTPSGRHRLLRVYVSIFYFLSTSSSARAPDSHRLKKSFSNDLETDWTWTTECVFVRAWMHFLCLPTLRVVD